MRALSAPQAANMRWRFRGALRIVNRSRDAR
jgi:hypothetical protein